MDARVKILFVMHGKRILRKAQDDIKREHQVDMISFSNERKK